jgi:hypothetical protein
VYIPAGAEVGSCAFSELQALFSDSRLLHIERAPWVPWCLNNRLLPRGRRQSCERRGTVPLALRGKLQLWVLNTMPSSPPSETFPMRDAVHAANGLQPGGPAYVAPDTIVLVRSDGVNKRRIWNESAVAAAVHTWAAAAHPGTRLVDFRGGASMPSYRAQIALFARAKLVVANFGSALHNCWLMRPGAIVVEIHGALMFDHNDEYGYYRECALVNGLRHVHYVVEDAYPAYARRHPRTLPRSRRGASYKPATYSYVEPPALVRFLSTVLPSDAGRAVSWANLFAAYDRWVAEKGSGHVNHARRPPNSLPSQYLTASS